jgi:hypothetical protein
VVGLVDARGLQDAFDDGVEHAPQVRLLHVVPVAELLDVEQEQVAVERVGHGCLS